MPKLSADEIRSFLDEPGHLARIATVGADGAPSVAPIWFLFDSDRLWFTPRLKSGWWGDIQHEPRVAMTIDEDTAPYRKVFVKGAARVDFAPGDDDAWRRRYRDIAVRYTPDAFADAYINATVEEPRALAAVAGVRSSDDHQLADAGGGRGPCRRVGRAVLPPTSGPRRVGSGATGVTSLSTVAVPPARSLRPLCGHRSASALTTDWNPLLRSEFDKPYWSELMSFVTTERQQATVYPGHDEVFAALHLTPYAEVKVLILGQDPYHGPGQAHGPRFSVRRGIAVPPSLVNIFQELHDDLGCPIPGHGNLEAWAAQGVLLLNTTLTVRASQAASHQKKGWEIFTDEVIRAVSAKQERVVFVLWGSHARAKQALVDRSRHVVIESPHPSPLSAYRGFFGSKPFSRANEALRAAGRNPVAWCIEP